MELLILPGIWFIALWLGEIVAPYYPAFDGAPRRKLGHDAVNLALASLGVLTMFVFGAGVAAACTWAEAREVGLLHVVRLSAPVETVLALVAIDLWMYGWHRANHRVAFLWRFHQVHHSDAQMDVSTAIRFHPGELALSACARAVVLPALGTSLAELLLYETLLLCIIFFHHSNVRLPRTLDMGLMVAVVTPAMHRVHHSRERAERDSNYGSVLPLWDRLLGTFRRCEDARRLRLGLDGHDDPARLGFPGLLRTPFRRLPRRV